MQTSLAPGFKDKIANYLSYPLQTSEICERIAIHAKGYPFTFSYFGLHAPKQTHPESKAYEVCTLSFATKFVPNEGCIRPEWEMLIRPILRKQRSVIRELLESEGFQIFEKWLTSPRNPTWFSSSHRLKVEYLPEKQKLIWHDSA